MPELSVRFLQDPIKLLLHSDGSLSTKDKEKILTNLGEDNILFSNPTISKRIQWIN